MTAATVADAPMRRTRSGLVNTSSETRTLKAVAAALQSASLPTGPLGQRRKREDPPGLMTGDMQKYVPGTPGPIVTPAEADGKLSNQDATSPRANL